MRINFKPFPRLTTKRLILRKLRKSDIPLIYNYQSNNGNFPYVNMETYREIKQAQMYVSRMNEGIAESRWLIWAIALQETKEIIGTISIWNFNHQENKAELGYGLYPGNQSKGYMTEALCKACNYAFKVIGLSKVEAYTNVLNIKSLKLLERCDFTYVKTVTEQGTNMAVYEKVCIND